MLVLLLVLGACRKEVPTDAELARNQLYLIMKQWYLWYKEMPDIDVNNYSTPEELMEALRYQPQDKWSYVTTKDEFESYYVEGEYIGYGFGYQFDVNSNIWITFVFNDSPLAVEGIRRGWRIKKIDNTVPADEEDLTSLLGANELGVSHNFEFIDTLGTSVSYSFAKKVITMNSILRLDTLMVNNRVVGHLVLKSFIEPTITELSNAFEYLYNVGAEELILDLRYNSGGRMDVTTQLASLIAKESMVGQPFIRSTYNDKNPSRNSVYAFQGTNSSEVPVPVQLDLDRLIVLTSKQTASASEAIINGLDPYLNVVLIGDDTYGKPVGMDAWLYRTYAFVPITFRLTNANDVGDYFDGIKADSFIQDDPSLDFSNRSETTLKEAIYYLKTGTFTGASGKKSQRRTDQPELQCLRDEIGAL